MDTQPVDDKDVNNQPIPPKVLEATRILGSPSFGFGKYERRKSIQWSVWWAAGVLYFTQFLGLFIAYPLQWMLLGGGEKVHAVAVLGGPLLISLYQYLQNNQENMTHI